LFFDEGLDAVNFVEVARRAGVSRQSIYRRWPSREALVLAAVDGAPIVLPEPVGTTMRDRLVSMLATVDPVSVGARLGRLVGRLATGAESHPQILERCLAHFIDPRRRQMLDELQRGVARGELREDVDLLLVADALTAPLLFRFMVAPADPESGQPPAVDPAMLVDLVLHGSAPPSRPDQPVGLE
jgi:AcrR family transcriptional regulator